MNALLDQLNMDIHRQSIAAMTLEGFPHPRVVKRLLKCLKSNRTSFLTRSNAIKSLGAIGDRSALEGLKDMLTADDKTVIGAHAIAACLEGFDDEGYSDMILRRFRHDNAGMVESLRENLREAIYLIEQAPTPS